MPDLPRSSAALSACLVILGLSLPGCSRSPAADLAQARDYIARHDRAGAEVALKAYLQQHPDSAEARYLLGMQLLSRREAVSALIELERARSLGHDASLVVPAQAQAMLTAGQPRRVIDELAAVALTEPAARAKLAGAVAQAWVQVGDPARAKAVLAEALRATPDAGALRLMQLWLGEADTGAAATLAALDALLARQPDSVDGWIYRGELLMRSRQDEAGAIEAYRRALALQPEHVAARANLVALLLQRQALPEAREAFATLRKLAPRDLATGLLEARLAILDGNRAQARSVYQAMLRSMAEHPTLLLAAADNELRLGDRVQAEVLASKLMARYPADVGARRLLAQIHLADALPGKAAAVLAPVADRPDAPADVLAIAAQAELLDGRAARAESLFKRLKAAKPSDAGLRTFIATSPLAGPTDPVQVAGQLAAIAAQDEGITADLALVAARQQAGDVAGALAAVQAIVRKQPAQPMPLLLQAQLLQRQGDAAGARKALDAALALDAGYLPAVAGLAALDLAQGQGAHAKARFEALIARQPNDAAARLAFAELLSRQGAPAADVSTQLDLALKAAPARPEVRLARIRHEIARGRWGEALSAAQAGLVALPDHLELLEALARIQEHRGETEPALAAYGKLAARPAGAVAGQLGMARIHTANAEWTAAERAVERVLQADPAQPEALALRATIQLRQGQYDAALASARRLQAARPGHAAGDLLEADIAAAQGRWSQVALASRAALGKSEPGLAPMKLHHALGQAGPAGGATAFAERWLKEHPSDTAFRFYLADGAQQAGDLAAAERGYRAVLALDPRHAPALNNLDLLLLQAGRPEAQTLIEQAVAAAPADPAVLDTQARLHAAHSRWPEAIAVQKQAVALAPRAADLRLQLAAYQRAAGQAAQARAGLQRILDERLALTAAQRAELDRLNQPAK